MEPSVKGIVVVGAVTDVRHYRDDAKITLEQLEARLSPEALELIDCKIDIGRWYPLAPFAELSDTGWDIASGRDPEFARRAGAVSADRLFERSLYQQLDYVERAPRAQSRKALVRQARLISTITNTLYNFLEVEVRVDEQQNDSLEIVYGNAELFSDILRYSTEGFMSQINDRQGSGRRWTSERVRPDCVVFRLPLPPRLAGES